MLLFELKNMAEIEQLENLLDQMFKTLGLDVQFSKHFIERLLGRERKVTQQEIAHAFSELKKKYKTKLLNAKKKGSYEAILQDLDTELNIVFGIKEISATNGSPQHALVNITAKQKDPSEFVVNTSGGERLVVGSKKK